MHPILMGMLGNIHWFPVALVVLPAVVMVAYLLHTWLGHHR